MSVAEIEAVELSFEGGGGLWRDAWQRLRRNPGAITDANTAMNTNTLTSANPSNAPGLRRIRCHASFHNPPVLSSESSAASSSAILTRPGSAG